MNSKHILRLVTVSEPDSSPQVASLSAQVLAQQNQMYRDSGGVSHGCKDEGFKPAFLDCSTGITWLSRFADGRIAPLHVLGGLPDELVAERDANGHVRSAKDCVIAGFLRGDLFYTREQAARAVTH